MVRVLESTNLSNRVRLFGAQLFLCLIGFLLFSAAPVVAQTPFSASLDRNTVMVGESVTLTLAFTGKGPEGQPNLPPIANLRVNGVTTSQQYSFVNGQTSAQIKYNYTLVPTKAGDITIPALSIKVDGQSLVSQTLQLRVTPAAALTEASQNGTPSEAFIKMILPQREVYLGEVIPAEILLYFQAANNLNLPQIAAEGFTTTPMPNRPEQSRAQIAGVVYNVITFRFSMTATKTGVLSPGPATCSLNLLSGAQRDFFGGTSYTQQRQVTLTSETNTITVLPLPRENKPETFNGAIGSFAMNVTAGPSEVAVGDPVTVKIQINGRGSLDNLIFPPQPAWREFKMYPPSSKVDSNDPLGLQGTKTFEVVVSPQNTGIKELPPVQFSFFDPEQKTYRTLTSQNIPLNVRSSAATPQPTVISANQPPPATTPTESKEIVHIKPQLGTVSSTAKPLVTQPWFLALQALAPLLWIGSVFVRRQNEKWERNPKLRRAKAVAKIVDTGLQKIKQHAAANQGDEFFAEVFHLLQEQIGERLDLPASAITEAVVENELKKQGTDEATLALLHELFQACNQARYAPVRNPQELQLLVPKTEAAVRGLQKTTVGGRK